jgi:16S rRNA (guanine527-N7)-methyltransferase
VPGTSRRRERAQSQPSARGPEIGSRGTVASLSPPERRPLPTDHRVLPPLGADFHQALDLGLERLDLTLSPGVRAALEAQARLLMAWSGHVNLTAHRTPQRICLEHILDSLAAVPLIRRLWAGPVTLFDLGSGAGYPGLPLAIALPCQRAVLVDSIGKKARFLAVAAAAAWSELEAAGEDGPSVRALTGRAESLARDPEHRERWDLVTARAVAPLERLVRVSFPVLRTGGALIAWKRDDGEGSLGRELAAARPSMAATGARLDAVHGVAVPGLEDHRLVVIGKHRGAR